MDNTIVVVRPENNMALSLVAEDMRVNLSSETVRAAVVDGTFDSQYGGLVVYTFDQLAIQEDDPKWEQVDLALALQAAGLDPSNYIDPTKISWSTLRNRMVAGRVFPPDRRRWRLTIGHYIVGSNKGLTEREREDVMDLAEQGGLSREALRETVREIAFGDSEQTIRVNPRILYEKVSIFMSRSGRIYDWAVANGLPENLVDAYEEINSGARTEMEKLWQKLNNE